MATSTWNRAAKTRNAPFFFSPTLPSRLIWTAVMKTIGCLGQIDKLYGVRSTTRNWNTIVSDLKCPIFLQSHTSIPANLDSSDEDDWLSWPDRQALRRAGDDPELEHDSCDRADLEGPDEDAITMFDYLQNPR